MYIRDTIIGESMKNKPNVNKKLGDDGMVVGMIKFYDDGTYDAYGRIDQTICSLLRNQAQSTNTSSVACSASSLDRWDADRESLFKLMYKFASPENREMANSDPDIANMAHDFAEIVTHRSDLRYGTMSNSVSVFGETKF